MRKFLKLFMVLVLIVLGSVHLSAASVDECIKNTKQPANKIKRLDCNNKQLNDLKGISKLTNLEELNVANNNLKRLDPELFKLTKLKYLNASGNNIAYIPVDIKSLQNLETLNLDAAFILRLPDLSQLQRLKSLSLRSNQLFEMPDLTQLDLKELKVTNNYLTVTNIQTKNKTFAVTQQKRLHLKKDSLIYNNITSTATLNDFLRANIVNEKNVPIIGIKSYRLIDVRDDNDDPVDLKAFIAAKKEGDLLSDIEFVYDDGHAYRPALTLGLEVADYQIPVVSSAAPATAPNSIIFPTLVPPRLVIPTAVNNVVLPPTPRTISAPEFAFMLTIDSGSDGDLIRIDNFVYLSLALLALTLLPFIVIIYFIIKVGNIKMDLETD